MNQATPIIATDAVGAAAGGLVRDGETGLVVPAGDATALAGALRRLVENRALRAELGAGGQAAVQKQTFAAWAAGFSAALASIALSREVER